jgi:hypothetical protein
MECPLPMLAQDDGKAENKRARPEDGAGAGNQDEGAGWVYRHVHSSIDIESRQLIDITFKFH